MEIERWDWTYDGMELSENGGYVCSDEHRLIIDELLDQIAYLQDEIMYLRDRYT